jgi:hypothetical protein
MIQFVSLERRVRIRSSNLKLVDEEPTPIMLNEMEKLVRELPDTEVVALFKRISDEWMMRNLTVQLLPHRPSRSPTRIT